MRAILYYTSVCVLTKDIENCDSRPKPTMPTLFVFNDAKRLVSVLNKLSGNPDCEFPRTDYRLPTIMTKTPHEYYTSNIRVAYE